MKSLVFSLVLVTAVWAQAPASKEVPVSQEPMHHLAIENQYTRSYQVEVPVGKATLLHRHDQDYVYVVIGDAHISNDVLGKPAVEQQVKDGDVKFAPGGFAHVARNLGGTAFKNVTVEVLRKTTKQICGFAGTPACPITNDGPQGAIPVLESDAVKATRVTISAAGSIPEHRHDADHMLVAITDLHLKNEVTGKDAVNMVQKAGDVVWIKGGFEHTLTNLSKEPARFVVLEFR